MAREVRIEDHTVKEGEPSEKYIGPKKAQSVGEVTVNVDVDVSEALTCLNALQREAHEATEALRELEEAAKSYGKSTKESLMNIADTLARLSIEMDGKEVVDVSTKGHIDISAQFDLSGVSTKQLTDELAKREGVSVVKKTDVYHNLPTEHIWIIR